MTLGAEARTGSLSGLSEPEAREFHRIFMVSFIAFVAVAVVAHVLVWMWRPWLPGPEGYTTATLMLDHLRLATSLVLPIA